METTQLEQQKETQILKYESNLRDLWDNIKHINICIRGNTEEEREWDQKCNWGNYGWKLPKPQERKRYPPTGSRKGPKQDESKQTHTKAYHN